MHFFLRLGGICITKVLEASRKRPSSRDRLSLAASSASMVLGIAARLPANLASGLRNRCATSAPLLVLCHVDHVDMRNRHRLPGIVEKCGNLPNGCSATVRQTFTSAIRIGIFRVPHACRHHHRARYRRPHAVPAGGTLGSPTWSVSWLAWYACRSDESDGDLHLEVAPDADDARAPALGMCADRAFPLPAGRSDVLLASWLLSPC